ncbi:unnamed protein product [Ceutorhynchus assimilis]|uniref:RIIa domain-containing protein n=1 Tax=Ceutorhynchus assimilis TaxID=467358 RepID=A0A9P0GRV9_9CUCU|nr:unnamed protein product [Ceutorhynchus assimilis]
MHAFAKKDTDNLGMIVKRVSVPIGLEELMEGLTKEVLLKKPKDLYIFASEYFSHLVNIRDQTTDRKTYPIRSIQSITHLKPPDIVQGKKITTTRPTRHLSRQKSMRSKSPVVSKNMQTESKRHSTRKSQDHKENVKEPSKPLVKRERSTSTTKKDSSTPRSISSVQSTPREKRQNSNSRLKLNDDSNKNVVKQPKARSESKSFISAGSELENEIGAKKILPEDIKKTSQDILDSDIWAATTNLKQVSKLENTSDKGIIKTNKSENLDFVNIDTEMEDSGCDNRSSISNNDAISEQSELLNKTREEETEKIEKNMQETTIKSNNNSIVGGTNDSEVYDKMEEIEKELSARETNSMNKNVEGITDTTVGKAIEKYSTDLDKNVKDATNKTLEEVEARTDDPEKTNNLPDGQVNETYISASDEINEPHGTGSEVEANKTSLDTKKEVAKEDDEVKEANKIGTENTFTSNVAEIEENPETKEDHTNTELSKNILDIEEEKTLANGDYSGNEVIATKDDPNNVQLEAENKDDLNLNKKDGRAISNENEGKYCEAIKELEGKEKNGDEFNNIKQQSEDYSNNKGIEQIKNDQECGSENLKENLAEDKRAIEQLEIKAVADQNTSSDSIASEDNNSSKSVEKDKNPGENVLNIQMKSMDDSNDVLIVSISSPKIGESSSENSEVPKLAQPKPKEDAIEKTNFFRENEEMGAAENNKVTSDNNLNIEINSEKTSSEPEAKKIEVEADNNDASLEVTAKDGQNEDILSKFDAAKKEIIIAKEDIVNSNAKPEEPKNTHSLEVNKAVKHSSLDLSIDKPPTQKPYLTTEKTLAFNSVKDLLDFDNTLMNKNDEENNSSEESNQLKLIIVENESMDDNIPSQKSSNNDRNKRSITIEEIEETGLNDNSENSKDNKVTLVSSTEENQGIKPKTLDSQDTSLDQDFITTDSSDKESANDGNSVSKIENGSLISEQNEKSVSESQDNKPLEKDELRSENADQPIIKKTGSESVIEEGDKIKIEKHTAGVSEENTKDVADNPDVRKAPKIGDIEQVATVIEVISNIFNSKSTEKSSINEIRHYLNNFLQNEQSNVFHGEKSQQSSIESFKNDKNSKKKSMLPKSKQERPLSQTNLLNNKKPDSDAKFRRARSVGLIKTPETESRSKIPTSARRSASRRPLVRQLEADSKELEEKLKSTSKGSGDESLKNINGLAKDDVLIAKTILKGVEGAEKHIELIEEHLSNLENGEVKYDPKKLREEIEASSEKSHERKFSTTNTDKELSKKLPLDRLSNAALVIQKIWKGFQAKKFLRENRTFGVDNDEKEANIEQDDKSKTENLGDSKDANVPIDKKEEEAAIKIQSAWKGLVVRRMLRNKQNSFNKDERAIITIQAIVRGFLQRIKYEKLKIKKIKTIKEADTKINSGDDKGLGVGAGASTTDQNVEKDLAKNITEEEKDNENKIVNSSNEHQEEKIAELKLESNSSKVVHSKEEEKSKMVKDSIGILQIGKDSINSKEESNNLASGQKSSALLNSQTASQDLLHSSEFHATAFFPRSSKSLDAFDPKEAESVSLSEAGNLKHSSEFHDIVVTPLPSNESDVNIVEVSKMISPGTSQDQVVKHSNTSSQEVISQKDEDQKNSIGAKGENIELKDVANDERGKDQMDNLNTTSYTKDADKNLKDVNVGGDDVLKGSKVDEVDKDSYSIKTAVEENDFENTDAKVVDGDKTNVGKAEDKYDKSEDVNNKSFRENKLGDKLDDEATVNESIHVKTAEAGNSSEAILEAIDNKDDPKTEESRSTLDKNVASKDSEQSTANAENVEGKLEKSVDNINLINAPDESKISTTDNVGKLKKAVPDKICKDNAIDEISSSKSLKVSSTEEKIENEAEHKNAEVNGTNLCGKEEIVESTNIQSQNGKTDKSSMTKLGHEPTVDLVNLFATAKTNEDLTTNSNIEKNKAKDLDGNNEDETNKDSKKEIVEDLQTTNKNEDIDTKHAKNLGSKEIESREASQTTNDKSGDIAGDETGKTINTVNEKESEFINVPKNELENLPQTGLNGEKSSEVKACEAQTNDNKEETSNPKETNNSVDQGNKMNEKPDFYRSDTVVEPEIIKKYIPHLHESSTDSEPPQQDGKDDNNNTSKDETDLEKDVRSTVKKMLSTTPLEMEITEAVKNIIDTPIEKPKFDSMMSVDTVLKHLPEVPTEEIPKTIVQKNLENIKQNTAVSEDFKQIKDKNNEIHTQISQNKTFDNDGSSGSLEMPTDEVSSMDSTVTVILKPKQDKDANEMKKLSNKALSTSAIEDHVVLLDQVQNSLLDQLSGKPLDTKSKFDIDQLRKELHDASTMYTNEDHENDNDHEVMDYLYDFEPEDEAYDTRMVRTPLRELPDIAEETESKEEDGFCGTSHLNNEAEIIQPPKSHEIIIDNHSIKIDKDDQKLLHSSELHDSVLVPTPYEFLHPSHIENANLKHTSEFHDTVVLPLPSGSDVTITNASNQASLEEHGNETSPQVPPGASKTVTSPSRRRSPQNRIGDFAHAQLKDTSPTGPKPDGSSHSSFFTSLVSPRTVNQNMESERNNNNNKRNNAIVPTAEKKMEVQAATKIQAGFRGYQVRKQLKAKTAATDQKRLLRKRSSRENMKEANLEEQSAVKIQAGVRGFLVRRRQRKQVSGSASA